MKKTVTIILIALVCKFSIGQKLVGSYYDYGRVHPHEQYYVNGAGQKNGSYKEYSKSGVVLKEFNYLNGIENGACAEYAEMANNQRKLKKMATFKNGQLDGPFVWYCQYTDFKTKVSEGSFKNDKRTGFWKYWNCTDNPAKGSGLTSVGSFIDGKEDGLWTEYYDNGKVSSIGKYSSGKATGEWKYYNEQGAIDRKGSFDQAGKITGTWLYYDPSDSTKPLYSGNWSAGLMTGEWVQYYDKDWKDTRDKSKAAFYQKATYDNGVPVDGFKTNYFITGEKQSQVPVRKRSVDDNGNIVLKTEGLFTQYFKNGKEEMEGYYLEDRTTGTWKTFYENGTIKLEGD